MSKYRIGEIIPLISFETERNGFINKNDRGLVIYDTTRVIKINIIRVRCIKVHKVKCIDNNRTVYGYTFEDINSNDLVYNRYPVAFSTKADKHSKHEFKRITKDQDIIHYTDLYVYLSQLKTSLVIIENNRKRNNQTKYDKRIAAVYVVRKQLNDDIIELCKSQFHIILNTRHLVHNGMIVPNHCEVYQVN